MFTDALAEPVSEPLSTLLRIEVAPPPYEAPAVVVRGAIEVVRAFVDELDVRVADYGGERVTRDSSGAWVAVWGAQDSSTMADLLGGLRRAADVTGVDLVIAPALVLAERAAETRRAG